MCSGGRNPKTGSYSSPRAGYSAFTVGQEWQKKRDIEKYGIPRTNPLESDRKYFKRVGKYRQKQVDELASQRDALIAQQQAESQRLQAQMVQQQGEQSKKVAGLQVQQAEKLSGIKSRGQSVVSSLQILGQRQPTAPTASQTASRPSGRGAASTQANVARGSARSRGTNLSI
jgi:hypothetical protein